MTSPAALRPGVPAGAAGTPPRRLALLALANTGVFVAIGVVTPAFFFAAGLLGLAPVAVLVVVAAPILGVVALGFVDRAILQQGGEWAAARALGVGVISLGASGVSMVTSVLSSSDRQNDFAALLTAWMLALVPGSIGATAATLLVSGRRGTAVVGAAVIVAAVVVAVVPHGARPLSSADLSEKQQEFGSDVRPWVAEIPGYHRLWVEPAHDGDAGTVVAHYRADGRNDQVPVLADDILVITHRLDEARADTAFCSAPVRVEKRDQTPLVDDPALAECDVLSAGFTRRTPEMREAGRAAPGGLLVSAAARSEVGMDLLEQIAWGAHPLELSDYAAVLSEQSAPRTAH